MAEEQEILEKSIVFTVLKYLSYFLLIVTGFVVTKYLGPAGFGVYSALLLILRYSTYSFMGFYCACFKRLSFFRGKKLFTKMQEVRDNTFAPSLYLTILFAVGVFASSFFFVEEQLVLALRLGSVLVVLQQLYYFYGIYLRCDKEFGFFGVIDLVFNVIRLAIILVFLSELSVSWVLIAVIVAYLASLGVGIILHPYVFRLRFKVRESYDLFRFGIPTTTLGALDSALTSVDKLVIMRYFDRVSLGIYSFAVLVIELVTFIPANISMVILPSQVERYGAQSGKVSMKNMFYLPMMIVSYLLPIVIGGAFFFSADVLRWLFPKYLDALPSLYFLVIGAFFLSNLYIVENFIISVDQEKHLLIPNAACIAIALVLDYLAVTRGYGLAGIAFATALVYGIYLVYASRFALRQYGERSWMMDVAVLLLPVLYMLLFVYLIKLIPAAGGGLVMSLLLDTGRYVAFLICNIPLWYYLNKRTGVFRLAYQRLQAVRKA